ncbi:hypothetical protein K503DRAFT_869302 [Rhizopogon vinicolor AM-OR11-026]|uniref:Uncharacterized protein n=1 Tax=Rhizopogon vinicolor AM-OR11-026 TaxID=1314800 RepID=A0A1B7MMM1_9AGAM|nr:hypothetical protein K503DRAFT_869302 [Rhizopogon vinicolor AM-OR11-026]
MRATTSFLTFFFAFANAANVPVARTVDFEVSSTFNRLALSTVESRAVSFGGAYKPSGLDIADAEVIECIPDNLYSWDGATSTYGCITEETSSVHSAAEEDRSTSHRSDGVGH